MHVLLHLRAKEIGQIYIPLVNWLLLAAVVLAVLGFGSSSALASAYGIAVTVTMLITTLLTFFVVRHALELPAAAGRWRRPAFSWPSTCCWSSPARSSSCTAAGSRWCSGILLFMVMASWRRGRELLMESIRQGDPELLPFLQALVADDRATRRSARRSTPWPTPTPCRKPCCTT